MSTTAWLKNDQSVIQYFDVDGKVGIATSTPAYPLDINGKVRTNDSFYASNIGIGTTSINAGVGLEVKDNSILINETRAPERATLALSKDGYGSLVIQHGGNDVIFQSWGSKPYRFFSTDSELMTISNFVGINNTSPAYTLDVNGDAMVRNNLHLGTGHLYSENPIVLNAGLGTLYMRSNQVDCIRALGSNVKIFGNVWADSYSNLLIDDWNHSSTSNAPTNAALSNAINSLQSSASRFNKYLDTSNALSITVNWQNPSTNPAYFISLETVQNMANPSLMGVRRKRIAISTATGQIAYDQMADTFGSLEAYKTLNLQVTSSTSTSCTITSSTNWQTTGTMAHSFSVELLSSPNVGKVSFS
jgi:hypothetical protein